MESTKVNPLYGHDSRETAYLVDSYPYGRLRCKIWFWLEHSPTKGFRFCSQTENPKNGVMNAPKKSTYQKVAGNMYLAEGGYVTWEGVNEYTNAVGCLDFVRKFPDSNLQVMGVWARAKTVYCEQTLKSNQLFGKPLSEVDTDRFTKELEIWKQITYLIGNKVDQVIQ